MRSEVFQQKVVEQPDNMLFRFSLGQALFSEQRFAESIEPLEKACASREDWMLPRILLGKAYIAEGRKGEARIVLEAALALAIAQHHEDPEAETRALLEDL